MKRQVAVLVAVLTVTLVALLPGGAQAKGCRHGYVSYHHKCVRAVPSGLTGHSLPHVENALDALAIGYKTVGGGIFGIIVKSDWGVCATVPAAGQPIHGPVQLIVGHFTCGVS